MESYSHIELSEDEVAEAMIWRKRKKEDEMKLAEMREREDQNRRRLTQKTSYELVNALALYRMKEKFEGFVLDNSNKFLFELLCRYFGEDHEFHAMAASIGVENPSLEKGILLAGNFGVGKTWFMQLFQKNHRQVFFIKNCKEIANEFMTIGEEKMDDYAILRKNAVNDSSSFFQTHTGICLDDIGTEDIKVHFGNRKNVIGDLIERKYENKSVGVYLHATTNFTAEQLKEFYGQRVTSRMRQIFNFIELKGIDRRR